MKVLKAGLESVPGYTFSSIKCGIRYPDRLDYALILSEKPCNAAGLFTRNKVTAAPVKLCRARLDNPLRAILVNSTNANACTGKEGYSAAEALTSDIARLLGIPAESVIMSSTGIIGHQLPLEKMKKNHQLLVEGLSPEGGASIPEAIMTTDTFPKSCACSFETSLGTFTLAGTAKGSGMIAPNMATMLAFLITDAPVDALKLRELFSQKVRVSLNAITVDGDTSTNDTALILSPAEDSPLSDAEDLAAFEEALGYVLDELAGMLVRDGEGATKTVSIHVTGAKTDDDADRMARAIANSALVKTAFFGEDPNWGRIAVAAGYSGAELEEEKLSISFGDITLLKKGRPVSYEEKALARLMTEKEITVTVDLDLGTGEYTMRTTDFSYDYVKINAEYTT